MSFVLGLITGRAIRATKSVIIRKVKALGPIEIKPPFTKQQSYYVARTLIPSSAFTCRNCRHFLEGNKCSMVTAEGFPTDGEIRPEGTCTLWDAGRVRIRAQQTAWGRGEEQKGILPGRVRGTIVQFVQEQTADED